jgi:hypothetical protein
MHLVNRDRFRLSRIRRTQTTFMLFTRDEGRPGRPLDHEGRRKGDRNRRQPLPDRNRPLTDGKSRSARARPRTELRAHPPARRRVEARARGVDPAAGTAADRAAGARAGAAADQGVGGPPRRVPPRRDVKTSRTLSLRSFRVVDSRPIRLPLVLCEIRAQGSLETAPMTTPARTWRRFGRLECRRVAHNERQSYLAGLPGPSP